MIEALDIAYPGALPPGIRSRFVEHGDLRSHILEAGDRKRPCLLLLHGFPELAYSWRRVMTVLAKAGHYVVAPDQRGYGRTTGWSGDYDDDVSPFRLFNLVRDCLSLLAAMGRREVKAVIGHDFGSPVSAYSALIRPDVFRAAVMMSAPFGGPPDFPLPRTDGDIHAGLAALNPPRKHYQWYYSTPEANSEMTGCPEGIHQFLRAYYHCKSADWAANKPYPLRSRTAEDLAKLPNYYIMELDQGMAATAAAMAPTEPEAAQCAWLTEDELAVYSGEYVRNGFQGGLNWYRCVTDPVYTADLQVFAGRTIDVPSCFISGKSDWGTYQKPGEYEKMQAEACTDMRGCYLVDGAGHWVQQKQPEPVVDLLLDFLSGLK